MHRIWLGCTFATFTACCSLTTVAQEQQLTFEDDRIFDDASPMVEDNLPPGASEDSIEDDRYTFELRDQAALMTERQSQLSTTMQPFNSMRIKLIQALQQMPRYVVIQGQQVALHHPERVLLFYQNEQFPTVWTQEKQFNEQLAVLQELIQRSVEDALNPQHYHARYLLGLQSHVDYDDIIAYELLASDAYLTLLGDLANGLVDPKVTHSSWNAPKVDDGLLVNLFAQGVVDQNLPAVVARINAGNPRYQALKAYYNRLRGQDTPTSATVGGRIHATLRLGMNHPDVLLLREKLGLPADSSLYDEALKQAVVAFQASHGLGADGVVGAGTRAKLNGGGRAQGNLDTVMINMERQRWLPQTLGDSYILVNIPSYRVQMYRGDTAIYESKSVVGRKDRQTPAFIDHLRHIVMSPTWTVPPTIMEKDKLPRLRANPRSFDGGYEVVTPGGKIVAPSSVNWSAGGRGYVLRQKSGPNNALGRVKFLFPNKHAIYLHDTPSKGLFNRSERAYSSGCVRLQKPLELANVLLSGTQWTADSIEQATSQRRERWVDPPHETPIYLVYWTLWADPSGQIHQASDIYDLDNRLLKQYNSALSNP